MEKIFDINQFTSNINNHNILKAYLTTNMKLSQYNKVLCSISGGSDSDTMLDMVYRCDTNNVVDYVYFDTGLEYMATKEHIKFLEEKYNINIEIIKPKIPIPISCKVYGQPFISKHVSEMISRLQRHGFQWEDEEFEVLYNKYPKCKSALEWWTNSKPSPSHNIKQNKLLKEFIISNPPTFKISQQCCKYAKKDLVHNKMKEGYELDISGIRKAEGGARATAYKSCFDNKEDSYDRFRPLFWFNNEDKLTYNKMYGVSNSKCYSYYGLKRTGCCGCPFGREYEFELEVLRKYEPKLFNAVINIFKDSYEYTRLYNEFTGGETQCQRKEER